MGATRAAPLQVGIHNHPPEVFWDEAGIATGFWPELLNHIAADEGWTIEYVSCEWDTCLDDLAAQRLDLMLDVSYAPERELRFDLNRTVVVTSWSVIYVRSGDSLESLVELQGKRLGVIIDSVQYSDLRRRLHQFAIEPEFVPLTDYHTMLSWLEAGKIDAVVINKSTGKLEAQHHHITPTNLLVAPTQSHFAIAANGETDILRTLDARVHALKADPDSVYYQLKEKWLGPETSLSWGDIRRALMVPALLGVGMVAIAALLINRHLWREICRRRQVEAALSDSEAWLQRVLASTEIICWEEDLQRGQTRCFGFQMPTGWQPLSPCTTTAAWLTPLMHPDDQERVQAARQQAIATHGELAIEHRLRLPNQQVLWVLTVGQVTLDERGQPAYFIGSSLNISDRKATQRSLLTREAHLQLSLELTHLGTWEWHVADNRVFWSDSHFQLMGIAPNSLTPTYETWRKAIHPEDVERVEAAIAAVLHHQADYFEEYRIIRPDGSIRWIWGHGRGICNESGETVQMLGVSLDITAKKATEAALQQSEATKRQVLEAIPDLLLWMTTEGICEGVAGGEGVNNLLPAATSLGRNQFDVLPPPLAELRRRAIAAVMTTGEIQRYEQAIAVDGHLQHEEVRVVPIEANRVLVIVRDISDRKQAELALAESEHRYRLVTENMTDLVCLHDRNGDYLYVTPSCQSLLGYPQSELIGKSPLPFLHPDDLAQVSKSQDLAIADTTSPIRYRIRHHEGHYIWLETLTKPIRDAQGHLTHWQTTSREVSAHVLMEAQLRHDALHDALTHLPNRLLLMERLELAIKRYKRHPEYEFAVLFVDFDRFKYINDSLGHAVGDQLLISIAERLPPLLRAADLVARIGGDEFVILLEELEPTESVVQIAERILTELRSPFCVQGQEIFMSASLGIVTGSAADSADVLMRNADIAMYRAKAKGRDGYAIFDPEMHAQMLHRLQIENDFRRAFDNDEFRLVYQPIVALNNLRIVGFEALLRWQHPTRGLLTPEQFIDIIEETDMINTLGEWVLLTACRQVGEWQAQHLTSEPLRLTVNLSVKQLQRHILIPQLQKVLAQTRIMPQYLTLEITESLLVENIEATDELLQQVQALGAKISIDDFGTGYSSLSYLHQLPVDSLKVDRAFVSPPVASCKSRTIAESIVGLSNLLDLKAIAEGIETPQQLAWLRSLNCEYGQGYLFSQAVPAAEAERLLRSSVALSSR